MKKNGKKFNDENNQKIFPINPNLFQSTYLILKAERLHEFIRTSDQIKAPICHKYIKKINSMYLNQYAYKFNSSIPAIIKNIPRFNQHIQYKSLLIYRQFIKYENDINQSHLDMIKKDIETYKLWKENQKLKNSCYQVFET